MLGFHNFTASFAQLDTFRGERGDSASIPWARPSIVCIGHVIISVVASLAPGCSWICHVVVLEVGQLLFDLVYLGKAR